MKPRIRRADESEEVLTEERCHILEISGRSDDPDLSIARARVEPGVTTQLHALEIAERYIIVSGQGEMELGGGQGPGGGPMAEGEHAEVSRPQAERSVVRPGDVVLIPPGVPQRITNTGAEDLVFYCICTPAWEEEVYKSLE